MTLTRLSARYARPQRRSLISALMLLLVGVAADVLTPWPMKLIVDHVLLRHPLPQGAAWLPHLPGAVSSHGLIAWLAVGLAVLYVLGAGARTAQQYLLVGAAARAGYALA